MSEKDIIKKFPNMKSHVKVKATVHKILVDQTNGLAKVNKCGQWFAYDARTGQQISKNKDQKVVDTALHNHINKV